MGFDLFYNCEILPKVFQGNFYFFACQSGLVFILGCFVAIAPRNDGRDIKVIEGDKDEEYKIAFSFY